MTVLILGLILWTVAHFAKRLAPELRQTMTNRMGNTSRGLIAAAIAISVVMMIFGYRMADVNVVYSLPAWAGYLNNLLMIVAFFLFGVGSKGSWLGARMRHPMLISMKIWAVAHLLVNGDVASIVLFGGLLIWAIVSVILINRSDRSWTPDHSVTFGRRDVTLIIIWTIMFAVVAAVHIWLGHNPFLGKY